MSLLKSGESGKRRQLLRVLVKVMVCISLLMFAWVVFTPLFKNKTPVNAKVVETVFDVSEMKPGEVILLEWFNKPLIIARRNPALEQSIVSTPGDGLRDPLSEKSNQPEFAENALRSSTAGWFVSLGLGSGTGCALVYKPSLNVGADSPGGFSDPCDASRYDLAGRVLIGQSAVSNTHIPVWRFDAGRIIVSTGKP